MTAGLEPLRDDDVDPGLLERDRLCDRRRRPDRDRLEAIERRDAEGEAEDPHILLGEHGELVVDRPRRRGRQRRLPPTSAAHSATRSSEGGGRGANRFTANGSSVSARVSRIAARSSSGESAAPATEPSPPASETAAASARRRRPARHRRLHDRQAARRGAGSAASRASPCRKSRRRQTPSLNPFTLGRSAPPLHSSRFLAYVAFLSPRKQWRYLKRLASARLCRHGAEASTELEPAPDAFPPRTFRASVHAESLQTGMSPMPVHALRSRPGVVPVWSRLGQSAAENRSAPGGPPLGALRFLSSAALGQDAAPVSPHA